tara:strand:- start:99 stop:1607 length:1509 start_codon:yes stop_codon:yes gene_type:complete
LAVGTLWLIWTTRDNCPVERVIPGNQTYYFQARDLLYSRQELAHSALWETGLVPDAYAQIPTWMGNSFGYPDWVLNNLVSDVCYVSGTDFVAFSDLLVVTRMSRIGALLERYHRFMDGIEDEHAGGLALRRLENVDGYYAVRGRTLIFSPSRDAIVRALTLRETDAIETLETAGLDGVDDLEGRVAFSQDEPLGAYFEQADCRLDLAATAIAFSSHAILKPEWRAQFDALNLPKPRGEMSAPEHGGLVIAGDFGVPLARVWDTLDQLTGNALQEAVVQFGPLDQLTAAEQEIALSALQEMAGVLGDRFSIRLAGFDLDGMVPMPVLDVSLKPNLEGFNMLLPPPAPTDGTAAPEGVGPFVMGEDGVTRLPLGWGDIVEPSGFWAGNDFHTVLHPYHVAMLTTQTMEQATVSEAKHMFMRVRPPELVETLYEGAMIYASLGMIRGQDEASVEQYFAEIQQSAKRIPELSAMLGYEDGVLSLEIRLALESATPDQLAESMTTEP